MMRKVTRTRAPRPRAQPHPYARTRGDAGWSRGFFYAVGSTRAVQAGQSPDDRDEKQQGDHGGQPEMQSSQQRITSRAGISSMYMRRGPVPWRSRSSARRQRTLPICRREKAVANPKNEKSYIFEIALF